MLLLGDCCPPNVQTVWWVDELGPVKCFGLEKIVFIWSAFLTIKTSFTLKASNHSTSKSSPVVMLIKNWTSSVKGDFSWLNWRNGYVGTYLGDNWWNSNIEGDLQAQTFRGSYNLNVRAMSQLVECIYHNLKVSQYIRMCCA